MKITINQQVFETIRGKTILDVLKENSFSIPHECDGKCTCGTCVVEITRGSRFLCPIREAEQFHLESKDYPRNHRLACQAIITGEVEVVIP